MGAAIWVGVASILCTGKDVLCNPVWQIGRVTFFWYGGMLFGFTLVVGYAMSLLFPPPSHKQLDGLCVWVGYGKNKRNKAALYDDDDEYTAKKALLQLSGTRSNAGTLDTNRKLLIQ